MAALYDPLDSKYGLDWMGMIDDILALLAPVRDGESVALACALLSLERARLELLHRLDQPADYADNDEIRLTRCLLKLDAQPVLSPTLKQVHVLLGGLVAKRQTLQTLRNDFMRTLLEDEDVFFEPTVAPAESSTPKHSPKKKSKRVAKRVSTSHTGLPKPDPVVLAQSQDAAPRSAPGTPMKTRHNAPLPVELRPLQLRFTSNFFDLTTTEQ